MFRNLWLVVVCQDSPLSFGCQVVFGELRTGKLVFEKEYQTPAFMSGSLQGGRVGYSPESNPAVLLCRKGPSPDFGGEFPVWIWVTILQNPDHMTSNQFLVIAEPGSPSFLDIYTFILVVLGGGNLFLILPIVQMRNLRLR